MRAAAERIVPVSLELGGKSPSIVYPDVDEDWAVDGIIAAMRFTRQSQSCTAGSRLFLHEDIFDSFLGKLEKKTTALKIGDPLDEKTDIGTIINNKQFTKVCKYVDEGLKRSDAKLVFGGLPPKTGPLSEGYYAIPTVFADRSNDWRLAREEIFGPVLVAIRWSDEAEAIRMANDSHYGLAAYVWTHDIGTGLRTAHAIESGWVQVNQGLGQVPGMSYGGYKQSGIGREFSLEGMLDSFTQRKNVTVNLDVRRLSWTALGRNLPMMIGRALVGVTDPIEQGLVERPADQLQADRRAVAVEAAGHRQRRQAERVEGPREAGEARHHAERRRTTRSLDVRFLDGRHGEGDGRQHDGIDAVHRLRQELAHEVGA